MKPTFEEALEFCIQHYTDRRNPRKHAEEMLNWCSEERIFEIYDIIQKQTEAKNNGEYYLLP